MTVLWLFLDTFLYHKTEINDDTLGLNLPTDFLMIYSYRRRYTIKNVCKIPIFSQKHSTLQETRSVFRNAFKNGFLLRTAYLNILYLFFQMGPLLLCGPNLVILSSRILCATFLICVFLSTYWLVAINWRRWRTGWRPPSSRPSRLADRRHRRQRGWSSHDHGRLQ